MGRKQYRADLTNLLQQTLPPLHISQIHATDDAEVGFLYKYMKYNKLRSVELGLLCLDVDEYPRGSDYMLFAKDNDLDADIAAALEPLASVLSHMSLKEVFNQISHGLRRVGTSGSGMSRRVVANSNHTGDEERHDSDEAMDSVDDFDIEADEDDDEDEIFGLSRSRKTGIVFADNLAKPHILLRRQIVIANDLQKARAAGFRVGLIGDPMVSGIVCVSVKVCKLGISDEAMQAWGLQSQQYFVLLINYLTGYQTFPKVVENSTSTTSIQIRVGLCSGYKPSERSAFDAFRESNAGRGYSREPVSRNKKDMKPLFIGRPMNELFRTRFTAILKFRAKYSLGWTGAEKFAHDTQGAAFDEQLIAQYGQIQDTAHVSLPKIVMADTMAEPQDGLISFPLVSMQFGLRHFVRCTEFCLVCHCDVGVTFEAIKPYVCSNPLCLYQYMGLGFGPSVEWEILSQPYVVDLLISFCYVQAQAGKMKDFPVGMNLHVPLLSIYSILPSKTHNIHSSSRSSRSGTAGSTPTTRGDHLIVPYNNCRCELLLRSDVMNWAIGLSRGEWIAIISPNQTSNLLYHRIEEIMLPVVRLSPPICVQTNPEANQPRALPDAFVDADCYLFSHNFDELNDESKQKVILTLLDTLPPVREILTYLKSQSSGPESSLRQWRDRIIDPALNLLRWIIASNRSYIMQVDNIVGSTSDAVASSNEDGVSGMDTYMQFRFAQGAPDKEHRFTDCVNRYTANKDCPTLFAWHGSPLYNWHSIIREGLHFREIIHGRAFGNGVYMSQHADTSIGYMGSSTGITRSGWPNSELKVSSALSLNEVVNNPAAFVHSQVHYVVANTDWIQTRYLMVRTAARHTTTKGSIQAVKQDPNRIVTGEGRHCRVQIPLTAIPKSRRSSEFVSTREGSNRGQKPGRSRRPVLNEEVEDVESSATESEDRKYLLNDFDNDLSGHDDDEDDAMMDVSEPDGDVAGIGDSFSFEEVDAKTSKVAHNQHAILVEGCLLDVEKTSFMPGDLDMSTIQILPPPADGSRSATNALMKAFGALVRTQETTLAHELGWYINPNMTENMYQWVVELHSFDRDIPLAADMKSAGEKSIVMEMRFTNQYPFAPPFVRVVKPRFLPFNQGGGGHVTEGGAICMELLTNDGWTAVSSIESVLLQIRLAMSEKERPARLASKGGRNRTAHAGVYGVGEAIVAYERACRVHGWKMPDAFKSLPRA